MTLEADLFRPRPRPRPRAPLGRWLYDNNVTGAELARAIGADKATISRIAHGGSCSRDMEARIKKATGLKDLWKVR